jgi:hypothetical protein
MVGTMIFGAARSRLAINDGPRQHGCRTYNRLCADEPIYQAATLTHGAHKGYRGDCANGGAANVSFR